MDQQEILKTINELVEWIDQNAMAMRNAPEREEYLQGQNAGFSAVIALLNKKLTLLRTKKH